ncbi:MAG TPA: hypothetical protein DEA80_14420 [Afipia sp.]|nr:hypothetical protein [Afipia sp.]OUX62369.1 MAG: hypothetical protein CBB64_04480 [Afipia sp. TMED4]HAO43993.1 hypothetical protein [Afipia sp.]HAP13061.1 hypothetical protein [Afipia sp.]HAQ92729.1 hypothetical protein [Afipia sp.]|tara:strand:+ start:300 stop:614 length:315 start_codon:yes stop_codon:yes gene_type:complete
MMKAGEMARLGGGRLVKICSITNYTAECIWFDHRGNVHTRDYDIDALRPFWLAAQPRSLWPEINEMPDILVEALEAQAAARRSKRIYKQRLSNKIKNLREHSAA